MKELFFLVRLAFFPIAIIILVLIGAFVVLLVVGLSPLIVFVGLLAIAIWLLVFCLLFLSAAFENRPENISGFVEGTGNVIREIFIEGYFKAWGRNVGLAY